MKCEMCNSGNVSVIYTDNIECSDCKHVVVIDYVLCNECGCAWRLKDGEVFTIAEMDESDLMAIIKDVSIMLGKVIKNELEEEESSMFDKIHHCLRCGELAVQVNDSNFSCISCDFSWEVVGNLKE